MDLSRVQSNRLIHDADDWRSIVNPEGRALQLALASRRRRIRVFIGGHQPRHVFAVGQRGGVNGCLAFWVWMSVALSLCPALNAQSGNAQLGGLVTDSTGAVIAGAQIKAVNTSTNVPDTAVSNSSGTYMLPELLHGPYAVSVSAPGFGELKR